MNKNKIFLTGLIISAILYCMLFIFDAPETYGYAATFDSEDIDNKCIVKNKIEIFDFANKCSEFSRDRDACFDQAKFYYCSVNKK